MTWVRLDEMFTIHRKVAGLSDAAFRLHVSALCWSARNLMDGFVPEADLDDVCARVRTPARFAAECVARGAWHDAREPCSNEKCPPPADVDGWRIHDYFVYQFTKEQVQKDRAAAAKRQASWRAKRNGSSNAVTNGVSSPSPPRSEGKRGGRKPAAATPAGGRANPAGSPPAQQKPPWCGQCDETTRQIEIGERGEAAFCTQCHPSAANGYKSAGRHARELP